MTFDEANDYIQHRLSKTTNMGSRGISRTVPAKIRAHCFFSARVADYRTLEKIREMSDAFSSGRLNQSEARHKLRSWMKENGLDDGTASIKNLASTARIDLILKQNKRMAVAVGKYAQDRDPAVEERFPSWKYHCGRNPRDSHKALDGKVFRKNDPIWRKIFPPWEFNCNCWVENCDEDPLPESQSKKLTPQEPPESGFEFDPSEAFEDYRLDKYEFDKSHPAIVHAASQACQMELETLTRVSAAAGDVVEKANEWWNKLPEKDKQAILDYTASDRYRLNMKHRAPKRDHDKKWTLSEDWDMTNGASEEMDHLSEVLSTGVKYNGTTYRVLAMDDSKKYEELLAGLNKNIFSLKGFNSSSVTQAGTLAYSSGAEKHKIMFHIHGRNGVYIGEHSWIGSDEEVLFDRKIKFRALKSHEKGYIKPYTDEKGIVHIAITEV